jgi:hypothetical protein
MSTTDLMPVEPTHTSMLMPLGTADQARAAISAYEELKRAIVRPDDIQKIQGREFLKKSFWRRVATCFGLSLELVREERLELDGHLAYRVVYRAIAPNGRSMDGDGYCSTAEKGRESWPEHNVRATAHTRAKNRAISDLVGGGEVSAEEIVDDDAPQASAALRTFARANGIEHMVTPALKKYGSSDAALRAMKRYVDERNKELRSKSDPDPDPDFVFEEVASAPASLDSLPVGTRGN